MSTKSHRRATTRSRDPLAHIRSIRQNLARDFTNELACTLEEHMSADVLAQAETGARQIRLTVDWFGQRFIVLATREDG